MAIRAMLAAGPNMGFLSTPSIHGKAAAGATDGAWLKGAVAVGTVAPGALGFVKKGGTDPAGIIGVFEQDGPQAADSQTLVRMVPAIPGVVFEGSIGGASAATPVNSADGHLWQEYGISETANLWRIDTSKTGATGRVRVCGFRDPVGTPDGRVFFTFTIDGTVWGVT
jgi:hypothetical protein